MATHTDKFAVMFNSEQIASMLESIKCGLTWHVFNPVSLDVIASYASEDTARKMALLFGMVSGSGIVADYFQLSS